MDTAHTCLFSSLLVFAGIAPALLSGSVHTRSPEAFGALGADFNPKSVHVYVSIFAINVAPEPVKETAGVAPPPTPQRAQPSTDTLRVPSEKESNSKEAARLQAFLRQSLVEALRKGGFPADPLSSTRPEKGALLKGVFVEVDSQNHNCLAVVGGTAPPPKYLLYVGAFNLARPDQPLYKVMTMETCDAHFGPLISLNNYIPMEKYEVNKSPSEDEVRKVCGQIVANLTALLGANPAAFSQ